MSNFTMETTDIENGKGKNSGLKELLLFLLLAVGLVLISVYTPVGKFFSLDNISQIAGRLGYWGAYILILAGILSPLLFLPRWPIAFVAGLLYGVAWGTLLATAASTLGAILHFVLAKSLLAPLSDRLRKRYAITSAPIPREKAFLVLLFLRAFPLSNFVATNLLAGAMKVHFGAFMAASFLGMLPSSLMYAAWGKLLKKPSASFGALAAISLLFIVAGTLVAQKYFYPWFKRLRTGQNASGPS
jgi:uncharacterized membrane protein YdjX (TVP38/TMEM64 family)